MTLETPTMATQMVLNQKLSVFALGVGSWFGDSDSTTMYNYNIVGLGETTDEPDETSGAMNTLCSAMMAIAGTITVLVF